MDRPKSNFNDKFMETVKIIPALPNRYRRKLTNKPTDIWSNNLCYRPTLFNLAYRLLCGSVDLMVGLFILQSLPCKGLYRPKPLLIPKV